MWKQVPAMPSPATPARYVLDGGALLHRILWPIGDKFDCHSIRWLSKLVQRQTW